MSESRIERQMREYHSEDKQIQKQAMAEIVQDHQKYISEIINRYFSAYKHDWYADMFQWGIVGLIESLPAYDPKKSKPTTFFHFFAEFFEILVAQNPRHMIYYSLRE